METKNSDNKLSVTVRLLDTEAFGDCVNLIADMLLDDRIPKAVTEGYHLRFEEIIEKLKTEQLKIK